MRILPIFLPFAGCRRRCVFCDEYLLSGQKSIPVADDIGSIMRTLQLQDSRREAYQVAFYGGSFLSINEDVARKYLDAVIDNLPGGDFGGIRLSTTPDSINKFTIGLLSDYPINLVELGIQSFDEEVLECSGRPHGVDEIYSAASLLKASGIDFGVHLMTGLPRSTPEKELSAARESVRVGAKYCRLNPTLVFKNTALDTMMNKGKYRAQSVEEALESLWKMYVLLEGNSVRVIRMGICLNSRGDLDRVSAGPYHPAIGDLVLSRVAFEMLFLLCSRGRKKALLLPVTEQQRSFFTGHKKMVERLLLERGIHVEFQKVEEPVMDIATLLRDLRLFVSGGEVNEAFLNPPEGVQELCASHEAQYFGRNHIGSWT